MSPVWQARLCFFCRRWCIEPRLVRAGMSEENCCEECFRAIVERSGGRIEALLDGGEAVTLNRPKT